MISLEKDSERPLSVYVAPRLRKGASELRRKILRGGAWLGTGSVVEQGVRFGRNILLARLLAPEAFGTMAIILSAASVVSSITEVGAKEAIIQNPKGGEADYLAAAWWLSLGRAIGVYILLFFAAPYIGRFYNNPQLIPLLRIAALGSIFDGLFSSRAYIALKEMKFGKWAVISHGGGVLAVLATIFLCFFFRNVWALAIGYSLESLARCALSYVIYPYLPKLRVGGHAFRDLMRFSRGVFGLSFLNLVFAKTDVFVLGKLYPAAELGLYVMGVLLIQTPTSFLMSLLAQVLLPAFSQVGSDQPRLNQVLFQTIRGIILGGIPVIVFLVLCGNSLLVVSYGDRYGKATTALVFASCVSVINLVNAQITTVFYSQGLPYLHRHCVFIMAGVMVALVYPMAHNFGVAGGQVACLVAVAAGCAFQVARVQSLTGFKASSLFKALPIAFLGSLLVVAAHLSTRFFPLLALPIPNIISGLAGCIVALGVAARVSFFGDDRLVATTRRPAAL